MKLYERSLIINIIEAKLLDYFENYQPQGVYNNIFVSYLYKYIRENTYTGEHYKLYSQLSDLKLTNDLFKNTMITEDTDKQTFVLTDDYGITQDMYNVLTQIFKDYYNYKYKVKSINRAEVEVKFGWLPPNSASWLNIFNEDCLIDYYIDGVTLKKNSHSTLGSKRPDSGFVCYRIDEIQAYDTIMFLANLDAMGVKDLDIPKFTVATLLTELEGSEGAILNRIVSFDVDSFFYEVGPYTQNYLTATKSSLIIQIPYEYAIEDYYRVYDVTNSVQINNKNNKDPNNQDNYFVSFNNDNYNNMFIFNYVVTDKDQQQKIIDELFVKDEDTFDKLLKQYLLGDFIWKTSDFKLISYAQNLVSVVCSVEIVPDGVWSDFLSSCVKSYKSKLENTLTVDDVIDKATEEAMVNDYKLKTKLDPNEQLFNEW